MNYKEAIDWIYSTQTFGIKLGLENSKELLRKFLAFPAYDTKVLHVAGTNGKGSVCAMMEMLVRGAGYRTGLFTSPHLVHFRERIRVNSVMISEEECARYLSNLRILAEGMAYHPTFFELSLAVAMRFFKDQGVEYIILETGMGGRLDATTAVPADVCVITPIGMDHSEWLGDTLEKIALEKAGIMLPGVPVICSPQTPEVTQVLLEEANMVRCSITVLEEPLLGYSIALAGEHQKYNANVAVHAVHQAGVYLNYDTVKNSLDRVYWPGRFENLGDYDSPIVLDGAHNPHAAEALAATWKLEYPKRKPVIIFGAVDGKDIVGVLQHIAPIAETLIFTPIDSPRSLSAEELEAGLQKSGIEVPYHCLDSLKQAWIKANELELPILITGSLFLIGEAKSMLQDQVLETSFQ
jgi:dihydrofolate synthase / folylpolyglutamate synthase